MFSVLYCKFMVQNYGKTSISSFYTLEIARDSTQKDLYFILRVNKATRRAKMCKSCDVRSTSLKSRYVWF